jgi:hypothetical protein
VVGWGVGLRLGDVCSGGADGDVDAESDRDWHGDEYADSHRERHGDDDASPHRHPDTAGADDGTTSERELDASGRARGVFNRDATFDRRWRGWWRAG